VQVCQAAARQATRQPGVSIVFDWLFAFGFSLLSAPLIFSREQKLGIEPKRQLALTVRSDRIHAVRTAVPDESGHYERLIPIGLSFVIGHCK
jgi:hypothetical protein